MSDSQNVKQTEQQANVVAQPVLEPAPMPQSSPAKAGNGRKGGSGKLLLTLGIGVVIIVCCILAAVVGLGAAGVSIFSSSSSPVSAPASIPTEIDGKESGSASNLVDWPSTAYYLIGCDFYEVTEAAATKITGISGFTPTRVEGEYCYTRGFGAVSSVNSKLILTVPNDATGKKEDYFVDLVAKSARKLSKPANADSANVLSNGYGFNPATNMTMVAQAIKSGDRYELRLKEIDANGAERDVATLESRLLPNRGGITGDEGGIDYNSNGKYVLINSTSAGQVTEGSARESLVAVVEVATGRKLAGLDGIKGRWVSDTKFIYKSGNISGTIGDQMLYTYDVTTESASVLTPSGTFPAILQALSTPQSYILTQISSPRNYSTKIVNTSTGAVSEISSNPMAQRVGEAVYYIEAIRCEITNAGHNEKNRPGAVSCPMSDENGMYTHRLMRMEGGKTTVAAEFDIEYLL